MNSDLFGHFRVRINISRFANQDAVLKIRDAVVSKLYIYHYPKKRKTVSSKDGVVDVTELTMSDLGNGDQDSDDETDLML